MAALTWALHGAAQNRQGQATVGQVLKSWVGSFLGGALNWCAGAHRLYIRPWCTLGLTWPAAGNLIGSFGIVFLIGLTGLTTQTNAAAAVAVAKTSMTFTQASRLPRLRSASCPRGVGMGAVSGCLATAVHAFL